LVRGLRECDGGSRKDDSRGGKLCPVLNFDDDSFVTGKMIGITHRNSWGEGADVENALA